MTGQERQREYSVASTGRMSGWVAGINHGSHDASCALTHEGRLVVWIEQERLSRIKHAVEQSPAEALAACLDFAGIGLADLDLVALGSDHDRLIRWLGDDPVRCTEVRAYSSNKRLFPKKYFGSAIYPAVVSVPHHLSHAASAYYVSGLEPTAALVMDAMGEETSTTLADCRGGEIIFRNTYDVDQSLGYFYETATEFAGFGPNEAGKLMGLAAYGQPVHPLPLDPPAAGTDRIWRIPDTHRGFGRARVVDRCAQLRTCFGSEAFPFEGGVDEPMAYRDFAASAQAALERVILSLAEHATKLSGCRNLVLAGGVALNCSANSRLAASGLTDGLFVQPASTDMGVALGAALHASRKLYGSAFRPSPMQHAYWGLEETEKEIRTEVERSGLPFRVFRDDALIEAVATALSTGCIVAWHQGRAEVGPRALGARSLLGDPRTRQTVVTMNRAKDREIWRPLAPSVPIESFNRFFDGLPSPFMIIAARVRPEVVRSIPAVTHIDGSARPQAVRREDSPLFHGLLKAFERITGVPVLVNTSLNRKGEPICYRARDSVDLLKDGAADLLAIGGFLVGEP